MARAPTVSSSPTSTIRPAPKRKIRLPVKRLGAYMAMTCHCNPKSDEASDSPHIFIASGAAVMMKFIKR